MNIIERILAEKANLPVVTAGDRVTLQPSVWYISEKNLLSIINNFYELGFERVKSTDVIVEMEQEGATSEQKEMENFCKLQGVKVVLKGSDDCCEILAKNQYNLNELVVVGNDKSIAAVGEHGAIAHIVSNSTMAKSLGTGKVETVVPEVIYIDIIGNFSQGVRQSSIGSYLIDYFRDSLIGTGIIVGGSAIEDLTQEGKTSITTFFQLAGISFGIISPYGPQGQVDSVIKIKAHMIYLNNTVK